MKKYLFLLTTLFVLTAQASFSQKYKTAADTFALNKEYMQLSADIADLTEKLTIAQNKMPKYQEKAGDAVSDAQKAAIKSSEQSAKAIDGDVGDAKRANRKAKKALRDARDVENANDNVKDQEKKISKLNEQISKKQEKLQKLEVMRMAIRSKGAM